MKKIMLTLLCLLFGYLIPTFATSIGDFESRLREAEINGDESAVEKICKEWYTAGAYSPGLLNWNFNALMSVEPNALLFTQQDQDTYPALMLQKALGIRQDVVLINLSLLENEKYRQMLLKREGWFWISKTAGAEEFLDALLNAKNTGNTSPKPVYFGSMTNKTILKADMDKLYLTGLAFKYSELAIDNVAILRNNFENRFRTDYLEYNFDKEPDTALVSKINLNYIPALLLLQRHYFSAGETEKAKQVQRLALIIAKEGGKETEVRNYLGAGAIETEIVSILTAKSLLKGMKKVGYKLFAAEGELSNAQYELFLQDLLRNKEFDLLIKCKTEKTDWLSLLPKEWQDLPAKELFRHGHPDDPNCPVQNISQEAAQEYCAWITRVYNASSEKKTYKKVLFRLPTEAEWMDAARAARKDVPYPWGGYSVRNYKGCYLGNYMPQAPIASNSNSSALSSLTNMSTLSSIENLEDVDDGGYFTVPALSYYPNDFGLYAISGNVAEMIQEPGSVKGGSWQDNPFYGQIHVQRKMTLPSPAVGFRVFMEVIEE